MLRSSEAFLVEPIEDPRKFLGKKFYKEYSVKSDSQVFAYVLPSPSGENQLYFQVVSKEGRFVGKRSIQDYRDGFIKSWLKKRKTNQYLEAQRKALNSQEVDTQLGETLLQLAQNRASSFEVDKKVMLTSLFNIHKKKGYTLVFETTSNPKRVQYALAQAESAKVGLQSCLTGVSPALKEAAQLEINRWDQIIAAIYEVTQSEKESETRNPNTNPALQ